ncbi:hypothetical protein SmJEL517_g04714 [Synchytrium microbalum]|uniref:CHCH domain-containing protein n=1 Tax=Synchytrium microbalum TaxID=1806994 RepID=A0A507C2H6_9FUNG|nr:uncharacterized protein SmJEL517_g04714 [Synchytrium microbalum]TPX32156.1 hypothetical protein SmJEL517_g04714 [Synchytrium microbalum]
MSAPPNIVISVPHSRKPTDDEDDEYTSRIKKTGCLEFHEKLQDCYYGKKDWRACKQEMADFRDCFDKYQQQSQASQAGQMREKIGGGG